MRRLQALIGSKDRAAVQSREYRLIAYAVIDLQNTWIEFIKNFFFSCAIRARLPEGGCVTHNLISVTTPTDALAEAVYYLNPRLSKGNMWRRSQEPNWIDVSTLVKLSTHFGFSNRGDIYAALSYRPKALKSLPELRNFFAHRNPDTYKIAMGVASKYGLSVQSPSELALAYVRNRPTTLLQDWIDDLIFIVEYLCR
jgi:hypothetical protein